MAVKDAGFVYQADYSDVGLREVPDRIGFTYHREPLTLKCLPQVLSELEASDFSSLDCETTGLEFDSCQLISVNLSYTVGTEIRSYVAFYSLDYCLAHFPDRLERLPSQQTILDLVALALSRKYCSMHNRMFDQRVLLHAKPLPSTDGTMASSDTKADPAPLPYNPHSFNQTWDTLDMFWFLDSNVKGGLGLKELGRKYLGIETTHYEEAVGLDILSSPPRSLLDYGALDTYMTLALFRLLLPIFLQRYPLWFRMIPLAKTALYFMEEQHQYFNLDKALEMREVVTKELEALKEEFYSKYGYVNLGSNLEKSRLLFRLGYYTGEDNKPRPDGERIMKTSAPLLEKLASSGCEVADYMVRFSKLSKFLGTYMEPIILHTSEREDGSKLPVRFHFFDCRVPTGRYASGKYTIGRKPYPYFLPMNLQSISKPHSSLYGLDFDPKTCSCTFYDDPLKGEYCVETGDATKNIRSIFAAPPGYVVVRADYCSEELVIMANLSGEKVWLNAIRDGHDIHESTARSAWRLPPGARVDKNLRKKAKVANFSLSYALPGSYFPLVALTGLSEDEARELEYTYRAGLPALYAWKESVYQRARIQGYVRTGFGHERRLRSYLSSPRKHIRDFALKTSVSHMVQGEAGGIMRLALIKLYKLLYSPERRYNLPGVFHWREGAEVNPDVWFLNVVHDEICLVARVDIAPKVARDLSSLMSSCTPPGYTLPLEAEPEIGPDMGRTFPVHVLEAGDGSLYFQPVSEARPKPKVSVEESSKAPDPLAGLAEVDSPDDMDVLDGLSF